MCKHMKKVLWFLSGILLICRCAFFAFAAESFTILNLEQRGADYVFLSWSEYTGADGFTVYRGETEDSLKAIKNVQSCSTYNYGLKNGETYFYKVSPYQVSDSGERIYLEESEADIQIGVRIPENLSVSVQGKTSAFISWDGDTYADYYLLYRSSDDENWTLIKRVEETETNTYGLKDGENYYFRVRSARNVNGVVRYSDCSESAGCRVGIEAPGYLQIRYAGSTMVNLEWEAVPEAAGYRLYRSENGGEYQLIKTVTGNSTGNYNLDPENVYRYRIAAISENGIHKSLYTYTEPVRLSLDPVENLQIEKIYSNGVRLIWDPVEAATGYRLYRTDENGETVLVKTVSDHTVDTYGLDAGKKYEFSVKPICSSGKTTINGNVSEAVKVMIPGGARYRALLIGEEHYDTRLNGPLNDMMAVKNVLSGLDSMEWEIYEHADASRDEIISLMDRAFEDAEEKDVSLFYYSGHGVTGAGDENSGALVTVDQSYIRMDELAELLANIPGKVVVVLDSCGSGAAIATNSDAVSVYSGEPEFDPITFNEEIIQIFSQNDETKFARSGDLAREKFYVLTSSAYEQNSKSVFQKKVWGGAFTRAFAGSVGYDYNSGSWGEQMKADTDGDQCVTLNECYEYCHDAVLKYQDVQVYPKNSSVRLFYR